MRGLLWACRVLVGAAALCAGGCDSTSGGGAARNSGIDGSTAPNACLGAGVPPCGAGLVCDRIEKGTCVDPNWAEWPMPNAQVDVEAGAPTLETYTDNMDGTATDGVTMLMWQVLTPPGNYTQAEALQYCAGLDVAGYTDWRLPSVVELVSIVDTGTYNPSINDLFFPGTPAVGFYWSSTPFAGDATNAWGVYFNNGYSDYNNASTAYSVRCVR